MKRPNKIVVPPSKNRAIQHLHAKMRTGAGFHKVARRDGPTVEDFENDLAREDASADDSEE